MRKRPSRSVREVVTHTAVWSEDPDLADITRARWVCGRLDRVAGPRNHDPGDTRRHGVFVVCYGKGK